MELGFVFFLNSVLFGVGLAMDAFSVSMANGLNEPDMPKRRMCLVAGTFAFFQTAMPLVGWFCVRTIAENFAAFQKFIPWIALILLAYIGGSMLLEGIRGGDKEEDVKKLGLWALIEALIIGVVTFAICMAGLFIGRKFGTKLAGKASILGGVILIGIGIEIFLTGIIR